MRTGATWGARSRALVPALVNRLDSLVALIGLAAGGVIIYLFPTARDIGIVAVLACASYLALKGKLLATQPVFLSLSRRQQRLLSIAFWLLLTASGWLWQTQPLYVRPAAYFVVVSLLVGIIAMDIMALDNDRRVGMIMLKVLLVSLSVRAGIFYEFPSLSGADTYVHARIAQDIVDSGLIPGWEIRYQSYPIFHLAVAMTQILTSLSLKDALFVSVGLTSIAGTTFIYLIGSRVAGPRAGLLALLLANISDSLITTGATYMGPDSVVLVYFLLMLYLVIARGMEPVNRAILLGITGVAVFTHQLSVFAVLISLAGLFLAAGVGRALYAYRRQTQLPLIYLLVFAVMMLFYWTLTYYGRSTFLGSMILSLKNVLMNPEFGFEAGITRSVQFGFWTNLLFHLGYLILLLLAIGGLLFWLRSREERQFSVGGTAIVLFLFTYAFPAITGSRVMLTDRWYPILVIFLVILAAPYLMRSASLFRTSLGQMVVPALLTALAFLMIATPNVNKDNPLYANERAGRVQFTAAEVSTISTLREVLQWPVITDDSFRASIFRQFDPFLNTVMPFDEVYVSGGILEGEESSLVVVREAIFRKPTLINTESSVRKQVFSREFQQRFQSRDYALVYDNGPVKAYFAYTGQ